MDRTENPDEPREDLHSEVLRLRTLLQVAQEFGRVSVWERDTLTGEGRWDPHIFRLFGVSPADGAPALDAAIELVDPRDRERLRQDYRRSLDVPGRHETRYRVRHADGSETHLHSIWHVPADGRHVIGVMVDDTETVALAQRHEQALTHLSLLAKMVGLTIWRTDLATQRVYRDEQVWDLGALSPDDRGIAVDDYRALLHVEDLAAAERARDEALSGTGTAVAECRYLRADGGYRTLLTRRVAQRDADGRPVALVGVGIDITEQVMARERYQQLLDRYDMVVGATGVGVWTWNAATDTHDWNDAMRAIHGLAPGDPLPKAGRNGITGSVLEADRPAVEAALRTVQQPGTPRAEVSYRILRTDGSVRHLVGRARQLRQDPLLLCGIALDVTELHEAAQALRDREAAEQAQRARNAFLSRISHELRTPLNAVLGFSSLLLGSGGEPLSAAQREQLAHIHEAGRHLLGLVDDLLAIGHEPVESSIDRSQHCDLAGVVEEVLHWHGDAARVAGVQLAVSGGCPPACGEERHWRQIVSNLVSNAIKFNHAGGFVQIDLRESAEPGWCELEVRDGGRGIAPALQSQMFEPLNRLGAERLGIPGAGLGLVIARQLVQALGGTLTLHSQPGDGTQVLVRLPCAPEGETGQTGELAEAPSPAPATAEVDVVYVEDNDVNVLLVREFLSLRPQLRLHVAGTVAEAEGLVRRIRPWLLLVDMHLPDGDGHDLLQRLGGGGALPAAHCVALSADVVPDEVARARQAGFEDYWAKPIDLTAFLGGIDRLLAASG